MKKWKNMEKYYGNHICPCSWLSLTINYITLSFPSYLLVIWAWKSPCSFLFVLSYLSYPIYVTKLCKNFKKVNFVQVLWKWHAISSKHYHSFPWVLHTGQWGGYKEYCHFSFLIIRGLNGHITSDLPIGEGEGGHSWSLESSVVLAGTSTPCTAAFSAASCAVCTSLLPDWLFHVNLEIVTLVSWGQGRFKGIVSAHPFELVSCAVGILLISMQGLGKLTFWVSSLVLYWG